MPNPYHKCEICGLNHRPGNCKKTHEDSLQRIGPEGNAVGHFTSGNRLEALQKPSRVTFVVDLTPVLTRLDAIVEKLDRMEIAKQEIKPSNA
jgi:hypothetical protein